MTLKEIILEEDGFKLKDTKEKVQITGGKTCEFWNFSSSATSKEMIEKQLKDKSFDGYMIIDEAGSGKINFNEKVSYLALNFIAPPTAKKTAMPASRTLYED